MSKVAKLTITEKHLKGLVKETLYHIPPGTTETHCTLVLNNNATITETANCLDPNAYNKQIGEECSHTKAMAKVSEFEAYRIKSILESVEGDYESRLLSEYIQLQKRTEKLYAHLNTNPTHPGVEDLYEQYPVQRQLLSILKRRLDNLGWETHDLPPELRS